MKRKAQILALVVLCGFSGSLEAQMFGPRRIGRGSSRRTVVDASDVGNAVGDRRFIRGTRTVEDFVGADTQEMSTFVGSAQSAIDGSVTTAVEGLREQSPPRVNRAATPLYRGRYEPRLRVDFSPDPRFTAGSDSAAAIPAIPLSPQLQRLSAEAGVQISLAPTERVATLTGTVQTEHVRQIAEILVMFEPGVESVRNDLKLPVQQAPPPNLDP